VLIGSRTVSSSSLSDPSAQYRSLSFLFEGQFLRKPLSSFAQLLTLLPHQAFLPQEVPSFTRSQSWVFPSGSLGQGDQPSFLAFVAALRERVNALARTGSDSKAEKAGSKPSSLRRQVRFPPVIKQGQAFVSYSLLDACRSPDSRLLVSLIQRSFHLPSRVLPGLEWMTPTWITSSDSPTSSKSSLCLVSNQPTRPKWPSSHQDSFFRSRFRSASHSRRSRRISQSFHRRRQVLRFSHLDRTTSFRSSWRPLTPHFYPCLDSSRQSSWAMERSSSSQGVS